MDRLENLNDRRIIGVSLPTLLEAVVPGAETALVLPPVQRNAVWSPRRIVELWDSVLHDMPVGSFLVYRMEVGELARRATSDRRDDGLSAGRNVVCRYALFDGQQRLKALMHGWPGLEPSPDLCIWLDLGIEAVDRKFTFRVTTAGRPFGYAAGNVGNLSETDRRSARRAYLAWLGVTSQDLDAFPFSKLSFFGLAHASRPGWPSSLRSEPPTPLGRLALDGAAERADRGAF